MVITNASPDDRTNKSKQLLLQQSRVEDLLCIQLVLRLLYYSVGKIQGNLRAFEKNHSWLLALLILNEKKVHFNKISAGLTGKHIRRLHFPRIRMNLITIPKSRRKNLDSSRNCEGEISMRKRSRGDSLCGKIFP